MAAHDIQPIRQTPEEELMIEREFQALLDDYRRTNHRQKIERITRAFNFARMAHQGIRRRSGEPYIMHPLAVARIVVGEIGLGSTSICAALLHDVVEDTDYTVDDIRNMFDDKIAQIVDGVTKISGGVLAEEASKQAENFRKLLLTMSKDVRVVLVKLADRLHNMRTLGSMPPHKQLKIAGETEYIYAPLANRLGLHAIKAELENLCFHYEHPELYDDICERLAKDRQGWEAYFEQFVAPIREKFDAEGFHYEIKSRIKSPYSVWRKMSEHNLTYDDVYDVMAVRVIFDPWDRNETEYKQCWHLYAIMTEIYINNPRRTRNWILTPKSNGYEALHVTLMGPGGRWVEVQIRTRRMDDVAERGIAAHWRYKQGSAAERDDDSGYELLLEEIKDALQSPNADEMVKFFDDLNKSLSSKEIFVFTPKGDIKTITQGATALDFAFSMHTDLGQHCLGAKVNHKLVPLNYQLESGDQVEILTSQNQHPEKEWFNYVVTTHAKKCITEYFKQQDKALADNGRQMLSEALKTEERQLTSAVINRLMHHFSITRPNELMRQIGLGALPIEQVMQATHPQQDSFFRRIMKTLTGGTTSETDAEELVPTVSQTPSARPTNPKHVMLTEEDFGHRYRLAQCCNPIPGDDVMGALEDDGSIVVHKRSCPNAMQIKSLHGDTIVDTVWATHRIQTFAETIEIKGVDKMSILLNVINIISERYQINIKEINITSKDGMFTGRITIYVHDLSDISKLCEQLLTIPEVNTVGRIEKYQTK